MLAFMVICRLSYFSGRLGMSINEQVARAEMLQFHLF